jgi:energy-coupling factor transport system ATP-binding protein
MLLPLLERTLERAGDVAAALELRGFAGRGLDGDCLAPVEAHDVEMGYGGRSDAGIRLPPALALEAGTLTLVAGATGSGKSTLLRGIAGLHVHTDGGWIAGSLRVVGHDRTAVPPRDVAQRVGVVLQHPREAFATERVRDEIGLSLELRGVAPVVAAARVAEVAGRVGVTGLLDRPTRGLSAGEATLVAIAAAIVEHPILLLVDEPLADLDAGARTRIARLLDALAHEAGMCVVVAEHRTAPLARIADTVLRIDGGAVVIVDTAHEERSPDRAVVASDAARDDSSSPAGGASGLGRSAGVRGATLTPQTHGARREPRDSGTSSVREPSGSEPVLSARGITVSHRGTVAVSAADLDLDAAEIVALVGPNGAGKSSLLAALALPDRRMRVEASGRVALVPDASDDLFVSDTVAAECRGADRRASRRAAHGGRGNTQPPVRNRPQQGSPIFSASTPMGQSSRRGWRGIRAICRSASDDASPSPSSSQALPTCCSSTSRRAVWTPPHARWSGRLCSRSPTRARRCSWRRTSPTSPISPTGCSRCMAACCVREARRRRAPMALCAVSPCMPTSHGRRRVIPGTPALPRWSTSRAPRPPLLRMRGAVIAAPRHRRRSQAPAPTRSLRPAFAPALPGLASAGFR